MSAARKGLRFIARELEDGIGRYGLALGPDGRLETVDVDASVAQSLALLLATAPGERVMRPDYGCALDRLLFAPNDATTAGEAIHLVRQAVARFEPRAKILHLDAGASKDDPAILVIALRYLVRATGREREVALELDLRGRP